MEECEYRALFMGETIEKGDEISWPLWDWEEVVDELVGLKVSKEDIKHGVSFRRPLRKES